MTTPTDREIVEREMPCPCGEYANGINAHGDHCRTRRGMGLAIAASAREAGASGGREEGIAIVAAHFEDRMRDDSTGLVRAAFETALRCLAGGEPTYRAAIDRRAKDGTSGAKVRGR